MTMSVSHSSLISFYREISDDLGQPVNCIALSNDGNCILASCLDSTLRLLDRLFLFSCVLTEEVSANLAYLLTVSFLLQVYW